MKPRALDLLVCPIDKTRLELLEWDSTPVKLSEQDARRIEGHGLDPGLFSREIITGVLINRRRRIFYPIQGGIPRMLVFPTDIGRKFAMKHAQRITRELSGFSMPQEIGMPGEQTVLRSFSAEWVDYDWDGQSYWGVSPDMLYKCMSVLLDLPRRPVRNRLVLEVGIGIGGIADYMAREQECELIGIDLSYAVDSAYRHFGNNVLLHIVQASAFASPFKESTFDLVYSQGVLHHTFSTRIAFDMICKLPKRGGRLYVWLYNHSSEHRRLHRRLITIMESVIRPVCWRLPESLQTAVLLPIILLYLIYRNVYVRRLGSDYVAYGWREALHGARDRFTPRYAHRHTEEEVLRWFDEAGYTEIQCASTRNFPNHHLLSSMMSATAVDGVRC
jgi:uncharacterized protein YbaR (Trm112 family)/SAM-dependent methyltransferase